MISSSPGTVQGAAARCSAARTCRGLEQSMAGLPPDQAGIRLHGIEGLRPFLAAPGGIGSVAAAVLGNDARPVRAILFDKTAVTNWALPWHQDRTIAVCQRVEVAGFGPPDHDDFGSALRPPGRTTKISKTTPCKVTKLQLSSPPPSDPPAYPWPHRRSRHRPALCHWRYQEPVCRA